MKKAFLLFCLLFSLPVFAQEFALKNNLAYDALRTPNLSLEFSLGKKWTLDTQTGMNFFFNEKDATADGYKTKKWSHWLVQPEVRYWTCETFNGWFLGMHALGGLMNVGGVDIPFIIQNKDGEMKNHRYEGYYVGGGISAGYHWILSNRISLEATLGVGYARIGYDKFRCTNCGEKIGDGGADYVGPTKAAISIIYMIK
jgi:hypothetical protein